MMDVGDHLMRDPTYDFAKRTWDLRPTGLAATDKRLYAVGGSVGFALADERNGPAEPDAGEVSVVEEAALLGPPSVGGQVETFVEAALGMQVQLRRALGRRRRGRDKLRRRRGAASTRQNVWRLPRSCASRATAAK
jgi:hypothetical protein